MYKLLLACAVLFCASVMAYEGHYEELFFTEELFALVKKHTHGSTWVPSMEQNSFLKGATHRQVKSLLGVKKNDAIQLPQKTYKHLNMEIPDFFEAAYKWPNCPSITTIRDQSACGSCWAIAAAEAISDRYCTGQWSNNISISASNLMSCCFECGNGCQGGDPAAAWQYWQQTGIVDTTCQPYPFPKCEHHVPAGRYPKCPKGEYPTPQCKKQCQNYNNAYVPYKGKETWTLKGEEDFQVELMKNGPFEIGITVYEDFPLYKGGVYQHKYGKLMGGHAVRLVGWGVLNGKKYWKIANSWNPDWGMNGYILMARGVNECGVEDSGVAGLV